MNIKRILLVTLLAPVFAVCSAQNGDGFGFGVRAGVNISDFTESTGTARNGFFGGVFVDYTIKRFGLEAGAYYSQQGSLNVVEQAVEGNHADYHMDYVLVNVLAKYQIFNGFRIYAGPQVGRLINSTKSYAGITEKFDHLTRYDFSILGGVGYTFSFGLDLSASYTRGLIDIFKTDRTAYSSMFRVTAGWHLGSLFQNKQTSNRIKQ